VSSDKVRGRHWRVVITPLFDEEGHLIYLLHHVEDVTDEVLLKREWMEWQPINTAIRPLRGAGNAPQFVHATPMKL
jgi:hypothetical protein